MRFSSKITIQAPVSKVWGIVSNISNYPNWESGVTKVTGTAELGHKIKIFSEVSPGKAFPLKVTAFEPNKLMMLVGGMPFGLFRGTRTYSLIDNGGSVDFEMTEEYTGPFAPMITKSIPDLNPSFQKFTNGLKAEAEKK
jgi:hypothetical protein